MGVRPMGLPSRSTVPHGLAPTVRVAVPAARGAVVAPWGRGGVAPAPDAGRLPGARVAGRSGSTGAAEPGAASDVGATTAEVVSGPPTAVGRVTAAEPAGDAAEPAAGPGVAAAPAVS